MLNEKQVANIIRDSLDNNPSNTTPECIEIAAAKIVELNGDPYALLNEAAKLEAQTMDALIDLVAATVLTTLIEEEGGGRSNVSISPNSMKLMAENYDMSVVKRGMIRTVSVALKPESPLTKTENWLAPSNRHGEEDVSDAKPQAEPKTFDRPVWAVRFPEDEIDGPAYLRECHDRADAERVVRGSQLGARVENRCCLHLHCPTSRCLVPEVTS